MEAICQCGTKEDRVRANTDPEINRQIDESMRQRVQLYAKADQSTISHRIDELDHEWDMERTLEANASGLVLTSLFLGVASSRKWFILPFAVAGFLMQHAIQGWCPPIPFFRRRGVRTRLEIERERFALKLLRGDFSNGAAGEQPDIQKALAALEERP